MRVLTGVLSGILTGILTGILARVLPWVLTWVLTWVLPRISTQMRGLARSRLFLTDENKFALFDFHVMRVDQMRVHRAAIEFREIHVLSERVR
jgi:hypothetical protein